MNLKRLLTARTVAAAEATITLITERTLVAMVLSVGTQIIPLETSMAAAINKSTSISPDL